MKKYLKSIIFAFVLIPVFAFSQTNKNYIPISYSSICCGTPTDQPVMDFIKNFEEKNNLKPFEIFIEVGLGKEGEHTFYIGTDNLDAKLLESLCSSLTTITATQNKKRSKNRSGYVRLGNNLTSNATLKGIKMKPRTGISSIKIYDYKE
ncbi:hypothetical protein QSV08_07835 [Maribacter sp. BPC-D8]|uniref:hypothetical protein n=1 Tax=Maribacter sp. BPC-D8 TaxID=3053613 RepID=UPI002B4A8AFC|nr:hypothetical protein [Maribacter sp. BPC-D8]WRI31155.1 hypothetical protein QSV08_07835 [Maribacter sp. BPC-D8]